MKFRAYVVHESFAQLLDFLRINAAERAEELAYFTYTLTADDVEQAAALVAALEPFGRIIKIVEEPTQ